MDELSRLRVPFPSAAGSTVQVLPLPVHLAWRVREWACRMMRLVRCRLAPWAHRDDRLARDRLECVAGQSSCNRTGVSINAKLHSRPAEVHLLKLEAKR
jgi:hypothetical protein